LPDTETFYDPTPPKFLLEVVNNFLSYPAGRQKANEKSAQRDANTARWL